MLGRLFWFVLRCCILHHQSLTQTCRREYIALAGSLILIFLEGLLRIITLGLRKILIRSSRAHLSDLFQPNQSFDSATTDPKTSSIYFCLHKGVNQGQTQSQLLRRSRALRILWIYVLCLATMQKSMSCRQEMGTCLGSIASV